MENEAKRVPLRSIRCGGIEAAVWQFQKIRDGQVVNVSSVTITKSYKDKETQEWKTTDFLYPDDLPRVATVAMEAYRHLRVDFLDPRDRQETSERPEGAE